MKRTVSDRLGDAAQHAALAIEFGAGLAVVQTPRNSAAFNAILHCVAVIGGAVKFLPPDVRSGEPEIPWRSIAGMRDLVVHAHWQIEIHQVLRVVETDLPPLIAALDRMRANPEHGP